MRIMSMTEPSTIKDVARHAGVSTATVSRAFSHPDRLSEKTLKKVQKAAAMLSYKPNYLSQIFRTNRSNTILVMVPDLANGFFTRVLSGIEKIASDAGYALLLSDTQDLFEKEAACVDLLDSSRIDGIIQLGKTSIEEICPDRDVTKIPFVHAIEASEATNAPTVRLDNVKASRDISKHLIDLGHEEFALIGGPKNSQITEYRLQGFLSAMKMADLKCEVDRLRFGAFQMDTGRLLAKELVDMHPSVTAIVCMSDDLAIGALKAIREAGKRVPEDISVVGFDNVKYSEYSQPALTTVTQPAKRLGAAAMVSLYEMLGQSKVTNGSVQFEAEIVIRESCGPNRNT